MIEERCTLRMRKAVLRGAVLALGTSFLAGVALGEPHLPTIPQAPRTENGRFVNLAGELPHASLSVRLPFFWRRVMGNFKTRSGAAHAADAPQRRLEELLAAPGDFAYWVGHATILVRMAGQIFLTDPIWSGAAGPYGKFGAARLAELPFDIESLPAIDFVLISHNHYDHLDISTLATLAEQNPEIVLVAPLGNSEVLEGLGAAGIETLDWGETTLYGGLEIACLPVQHWSRRGLFDAGRGLWSSWAVRSTDKRFFFGGDTGLFPELAAIGDALGPFDLAALPIGAYEPTAMMKDFHMTPEETAEAAAMLRSKRVLAVHYGTFDLTDEPLDEPPKRFRAAMARAGRVEESVWILPIGDGRTF